MITSRLRANEVCSVIKFLIIIVLSAYIKSYSLCISIYDTYVLCIKYCALIRRSISLMNITTVLLIRSYILFIAQVWHRGLLYCATRLSFSATVHGQGTDCSISSGKGSPSTTASSRKTQAGIDDKTPRIIDPVSSIHCTN